MTEQSPGDMSENQQPQRKPLFDPYTGERLESEPAQSTEESGHDAGPAGGPSSAPRGRRRRPLIAVAAIVILALVGAGAWYVTGPMAEAQAKEQAKERAQRAHAAEKRREAACEDALVDTYDALSSIDSRLDVGMVEADYTAAVGEAKAAFDRVDQATVTKNDCAAYDDFQTALQQYSAASDYWNSCITDDYCTPNEGKLNGYWTKASVLLPATKDDLGQASSANQAG